MSRRRGLTALLAAVLAFTLSACAGLPTSGPVNAGIEADSDAAPPNISFIPDRPQPGASPVQIVDGFLRAGSGPTDNWATAREYLAPGTEWNPADSVTIDVFGTRVTRELDDDTVSVLVRQIARVDDKGAYSAADGGTTDLTFELAQAPDGEWRITAAPDGILLDRTRFADVFHRYPLAYFDPTWTYLVPDVRWFAPSNAASRIADALVNKPPSDWLAASVRSSFPEGVTTRPAVPVSAGVASVSLSQEAAAVDQSTLDRMQTQLEESLGAAGISSVQMLVADAELPAEAVTTRRTTVTGGPLVRTADGFGFLAADQLTEIPGLSAAVAAVDSIAVQVSADRTAAAVQTSSRVERVLATGEAPSVVDARDDLVAPSIDAQGVVWTVPRANPQAVQAQLADGRSVTVGDAWPGATQIAAMAVSRDGTRVAALVTAGGRTAIWVSGIVRGRDQLPSVLGTPFELGLAAGSGRSLAWLDDETVGVVTDDGEASIVYEQTVGGPGAATSGPAGATSIAGGATIATMRIRSSEGNLYVRRGSNWQETATGILVLATQQGMPE